MAEPTLALRFSDLRSEIAYYLGYGRSFHQHGVIAVTSGTTVTLSGHVREFPSWRATGRITYRTEQASMGTVDKAISSGSATVLTSSGLTNTTDPSTTSNYSLYPWSDDEVADIEMCLSSGLRQFYHPPPLPGEGIMAHEWSFLYPEATVTIFGDIDEVTTETVDHSAYDSAADTTTITRNSGTQSFYPSMVGNTFVSDDGSTYVIKEYVSATSIKVSGDASSETDNKPYSITTDATYAMADNHGGFIDQLHYDAGDNSHHSLELTSPNRILALRQQNVGTVSPSSSPVLAAEIIRSSGGTNMLDGDKREIGQRNLLMVWPEPNGIYTIHGRHNELQDTLAFNEYPLGGAAHSETILASCLAVAESRVDDQQGNMAANFQRLLAASVNHDRVTMSPRNFGYNADTSGSRDGGRRYYKPATYGGVEYFG